MLVFKMNLKRKENKKREKENKKSNKLWPLLRILLSRIKKNKLDLKIKKCLDTFKISSKNKNKTNNAELESKNNRKSKWDNILPDKSKRKKSKKQKKKRLTKNKPKFGNKTLKTFSIMRKTRLNTWRMSTNNTSKFWRNKWRTNKTKKTERKWTLWNFSITRP